MDPRTAQVFDAMMMTKPGAPPRRGDLVRLACSFGRPAGVRPEEVEALLGRTLGELLTADDAPPWDWAAESGSSQPRDPGPC